ncbi:MAG: TetR family transcriptional regulator [Gammaproteobacteria bacterium]|nr:MAG: TetR family transcriptional regulator [Gammaproteobacteria bacterium]
MAKQILDMALQQAESDSWEALSLHQIASSLDISLDEIRCLYPQKDDLVEAWFDRADQAVLSEKASEEFAALAADERLRQVIMKWFFALHEHRRLTRQMLCYKFEFGHVHLQVLGIMRISRTVQWFREAALIDTQGLHRIIEEVCLTGIYLASFARWLADGSQNSRHTDRFLAQALKRVRTLKRV